jgi:hypothetical protein
VAGLSIDRCCTRLVCIGVSNQQTARTTTSESGTPDARIEGLYHCQTGVVYQRTDVSTRRSVRSVVVRVGAVRVPSASPLKPGKTCNT